MKPADKDAWDDRYREKPLLWSRGPNQFVESELADLEPGTALDLACGEGRNAVWLAARGWEVTGVDFSAVALDRARRRASEEGVEVDWVETDVQTWEPGRTLDLVLIAYLHLTTEVRAGLVKRAVDWLAPGGYLFIVAHDQATAGVSGPSDPDLLWDPDTAARWVTPLTVLFSRSARRETEEGATALDTVLLARNDREE
ncbi:MAG: class I SAM-dependent methyltransferase [Acidimicrobiia bacterium]